MPDWTGKTRGGLLGYKSFVFLVKNFGISFAYLVLRIVVVYFLIFAPRAFRSSFSLLNKHLKFSRLKSFRYVYRTFYKLGQVLIDKVAFLSGLNRRFTFNLDGEEYLIDMAKNTGGVLIGVHAGSWEMAEHFLERLNCRINVVIFKNEHEKIQHFLSEIYKKQAVNFIVIGTDDYSHLYQIKEALKNKEIVAIHGDRFLSGAKTISKNFFNEPAKFPQGPFLLPVKYNVPVSFVTAMKETSRHYHFYATPPKTFSAPRDFSSREHLVDELLEDYVANLENMIRKYPDQWFNFYDFWNNK